MALFKPFSGAEAELKQVPVKNGYVYFTEDHHILYVDLNDVRYKVSGEYAEKLRKLGADGAIELEIDADEIVLTSDIIDVQHGGTGASTAAGARTNLGVYSKNETLDATATKAYSTDLVASGWYSSSEGFKYNYSNTALVCGRNGNTPPIITATANPMEYGYIISATATPGVGIVFIANKQPSENIGLTVLDIH